MDHWTKYFEKQDDYVETWDMAELVCDYFVSICN
jgi:hypothetical protein